MTYEAELIRRLREKLDEIAVMEFPSEKDQPWDAASKRNALISQLSYVKFTAEDLLMMLSDHE